MVSDISMYLDKNYVVKEKMKSIREMGLLLFKKNIFKNPSVNQKFHQQVFEQIKLERQGEPIHQDVIRKCLKILIDLGIKSTSVYKKEFESQFLAKTSEFYRSEATDHIGRTSCPEYLKLVNKRILEEESRCLNYLIEATRMPLIETVLQVMIEDHASTLIKMEGSGLSNMITHKMLPSIKLMYELFSKSKSALVEFESFLVKSVKNTGLKHISNQGLQKNQKELIETLIAMKREYNEMMEQSCSKDVAVTLAIKKAFESFINEGGNIAVLLARQIDSYMKKDIRGLNDEAISSLFDRTLEIFRLLNDKDQFENFYRAGLSRRLLTASSLNDEAEKLMISKLKKECGYQYTQKMEIMLKDMKVSDELMTSFVATGEPRRIDFEFRAQVLTTGNWSNDTTQTSCSIPPQLTDAIAVFKQFYMKKFNCISEGGKFKRLLTWKLNFGSADLIAHFNNKSYEMNVSGYQMCVLFLFNESDQVTYTQMKSQTQIQPEKELQRHVLSMVKLKLLTKSTPEFSLSPGDVLALNPDFKSRLMKFKIPLLSAKDQVGKETTKINENLSEDRRHMVEATIVRIMKTRKRLDHNELITEVLKIVSEIFQPSAILIKQRIESLIEKEYLARDNQDKRFYNYLA